MTHTTQCRMTHPIRCRMTHPTWCRMTHLDANDSYLRPKGAQGVILSHHQGPKGKTFDLSGDQCHMEHISTRGANHRI